MLLNTIENCFLSQALLLKSKNLILMAYIEKHEEVEINAVESRFAEIIGELGMSAMSAMRAKGLLDNGIIPWTGLQR